MHIAGHGYRRVPDADGRQLCTVMTSSGMPTHEKVSTGKGTVLSLALFGYLEEHAEDLKKLAANEETTHLSGLSTVVHDLGVYDQLRNQTMIPIEDWPAGEDDVRETIAKRQLEIDEERKMKEKGTPSPQPPLHRSEAVELPSFADRAALYEHATRSKVARRVRKKFNDAPAGRSEGGVSSMDVDVGGSAQTPGQSAPPPMPGQSAPPELPSQSELPPLPRLSRQKRTLSVAMENAGRDAETLEVTVPIDSKGGDTVLVQTCNGEREVKIPRRLNPGDTFTVKVEVIHIVN